MIYGYMKPNTVTESTERSEEIVSIVYNEYCNYKNMLESCIDESARPILEAQVKVLKEVSTKDIIDKIKEAINNFLNWVKELVEKIVSSISEIINNVKIKMLEKALSDISKNKNYNTTSKNESSIMREAEDVTEDSFNIRPGEFTRVYVTIKGNDKYDFVRESSEFLHRSTPVSDDRIDYSYIIKAYNEPENADKYLTKYEEEYNYIKDRLALIGDIKFHTEGTRGGYKEYDAYLISRDYEDVIREFKYSLEAVGSWYEKFKDNKQAIRRINIALEANNIEINQYNRSILNVYFSTCKLFTSHYHKLYTVLKTYYGKTLKNAASFVKRCNGKYSEILDDDNYYA